MRRSTNCASAKCSANGGRQDADRAVGAVGRRCTQVRCGKRTAVITRGYRLHGVTSFPIRRAEIHAYTVPGSSGPTVRRLQMSVQKPVLTAPHGGETVTSSGGSSV